MYTSVHWTGTGMWWGEKKNTYRGMCRGRIYQGKGREDDWRQDGKTRVNEIWQVLLDWERTRRRAGRCGEGRSAESGRGDGQGDVEKEDQLRADEETGRAMWRRKIIYHTWREKPVINVLHSPVSWGNFTDKWLNPVPVIPSRQTKHRRTFWEEK